jgi:hypothetical protein
MASKDLGTAAPHLKKKTVAVRKKQLQLQQMLSNPKAFLRQYMVGKKKVVKKKVVKRIQDTDRAWFGKQKVEIYEHIENLLINYLQSINIINKL